MRPCDRTVAQHFSEIGLLNAKNTQFNTVLPFLGHFCNFFWVFCSFFLRNIFLHKFWLRKKNSFRKSASWLARIIAAAYSSKEDLSPSLENKFFMGFTLQSKYHGKLNAQKKTLYYFFLAFSFCTPEQKQNTKKGHL